MPSKYDEFIRAAQKGRPLADEAIRVLATSFDNSIRYFQDAGLSHAEAVNEVAWIRSIPVYEVKIILGLAGILTEADEEQ